MWSTRCAGAALGVRELMLLKIAYLVYGPATSVPFLTANIAAFLVTSDRTDRGEPTLGEVM